MNLCRDCKFFKPNGKSPSFGGSCTSPHIDKEIDPVTGENIPSDSLNGFANVYYQRAIEAPSGRLLGLLFNLLRRLNNEPNKICGKKGRFFETKQSEMLIGAFSTLRQAIANPRVSGTLPQVRNFS